MAAELPLVYLARHGETAWSLTGQHTGLTDLALTEHGESAARILGQRLHSTSFTKVLVSPLKRAIQTCKLAGFGAAVEIDRDLVEWDYGEYEGKRTVDIRQLRPDWQLFRDGCPNGETSLEVGGRADRVIKKVLDVQGNTLIVSSGHFLRVLGARWQGLDAAAGKGLFLSTASLSVLGFEHSLSEPVIRLWNDTSHVVQ